MDAQPETKSIYQPREPAFQHQLDSLRAAYRRPGFAYFLDMGLGKSRVAIDEFCIYYSQGECDALLVVAPKSVYTNWTRVDDERPGEIQRWLWDGIREQAVVHMYRAGRAKKDERARVAILDARSPGARILVMNCEALSSTKDAEDFARRFLRTYPKAMFVIDESTILKNYKSRRTKVCIRLANMAWFRRIMTGSPSTGSPSDLYSQFEFLGPGERLLGHRSFSTFQARYCKLREIVVSGRTIKTEVGSQNIEELAGLVAQHSIRRRKMDCLDLPPKNYLPQRHVEMTDEQHTAYNELRRTAMTVVREHEVTTEIVITQLIRMHQILCGHVKTDDGRILYVANNRMRALLDIIEETDEQMVIWAGYRPNADEIIRRLRELYGPNSVAEYHGGVDQKTRDQHEGEFQAGARRFMVATSAGARGRTWTAATLVVYYSNSHDLEIRDQSEDRTHRIGTVGIVSYIDLVIPGTLDDRIIQSLRDKKDVVRAVMSEGIEKWI